MKKAKLTQHVCTSMVLKSHWFKAVLIVGTVVASNYAALANPTLPSIPSGTYNITSFGASTSSANNATAIQNAINAASAAGGGTVQIPSGTFLSGPLTLKNKINLNLASGAILRMLAYGAYPGSTIFIDADGVSNVKISGSGTIDGQGAAWWTAYTASGNTLARPGMIYINSCTNVQITGIKLQNAPNVHLSFHYYCNEVTVDHMSISAPGTGAPNTDGIDSEGLNFLYDTCNIADGDDNIAITGMHAPAKYHTIQNCTFGVGHGCSIGSYTADGVDHITVTNCTFSGTTAGIRIKSERGRGGVVQYLTYAYLTMNNVRNPIALSDWYPSDPSNPTTDASAAVTSTTPDFKHIVIENVRATGSTSSTIYGLPEQHISDVTLSNVQLSETGTFSIYYADSIVFNSGSTVTAASGNAVTTYAATVTGVTTHAY